MKKLSLSLLICLIATFGYSQIQKISRYDIQKNNAFIPKAPQQVTTNEYVENEPVITSTRYINYEDLDYTTYDWQTNHGFINRTVVWPDGKVNFAYTYSSNNNYSDRGTGIATYNSNTNQWSSLGGRIENEKTGFGSIARYGQNGLIVAAHTATNLKVYRVNNKDNMTPNSATAILDIGTDVYSHPCVTTSGTNHNIIHLVAAEFENNDSDGDGIENGIRYWRSSNGQTWDKVCVQLPYLSVNYGNKHGTNTYYWMETTEDNMIGLVVNTGYTDGIVLYSTDNGETWQRKIYFHDPDPNHIFGDDENSFAYPRWTSALWNDNNELMLAYEANFSDHQGHYSKLGAGVAFWSEYMPYRGDGSSFATWGGDPTNPMPPTPGQPFIMDSAYINQDIYASWFLWSDASHEMWPEYFGYNCNWTEEGYWEDPNAEEWQSEWHFESVADFENHGPYNCGSVGMPVITKVNGDDNVLIAVWCTVDDEHMENGNYFFKLVAAISYDAGMHWSHPVMLTANEFEFMESEQVYPQIATIGNTLIVAAQIDYGTGTSVQSDDNDPADNHYCGFTFNINELFSFYNPTQYYNITATPNPTNGGTVSGAGSYSYESTCTLHAYPNSGYSFLKWTKNGTQVSTNPVYSFTVTSNASYVAHFQQNATNYTITVSSNPINGGTVTGNGTFSQGSSRTVIATPNDGFTFTNWTENGSVVSYNASYTFTLNSNRNLVANFTPNTYTINVSANPSAGGTVTGSGTYTHGTSHTVTATACSGYTFYNWTENGSVVSSNPNYTFTVTANRNLIANFTYSPQNYTITVSANPANGGTVAGGGNYEQGQSCTVIATPANNFTFVNWTENGSVASTNTNYTFEVNSSRNLVANFNPIAHEYTITASADPTVGGTVMGAGTYNEGATCVLTAIPNDGYVFVNWTRNGNTVSEEPTFEFTVNRDLTFIAHFRQDANHFTITATADPIGAGSVSGGGNYESGQTCYLNAIAAEGYEFINWTSNGLVVSENSTFDFPVTSSAVYVAHFRRIVDNFVVIINIEPTSAGSVIGAGTFEEGATCTLIPMPNPTYSFVCWTENGIIVSTDNPYSFVVNQNRNLVAVFHQELFYTITASAGPNGIITPDGEVMVLPGNDKTFNFIPDDGCSVNKVIVDGVDRGALPSYTFRNVNENHSIHVQFSGLGVDDNIITNLKVYPNPAQDKINIESPNMKKVAVFNLLGVLIESKKVNDDYAVISTNEFPQGTYILKVEYLDGSVGYSRFMVAK